MDERQNPDPEEAHAADEYDEDEGASGAASLIGMRIRRRPRHGQGPTGQTRGAPAPKPAPLRQQQRRPAAPAAPQRPAQEPAAAPPPPPQPAPKPAPTQAGAAESGLRPQDIVRYWDQLRNGRKYPTRGDLDSTQITKNWPNSMLVRRNRETKGWQLETQFSGGIPGSSNGQPINKGSNAECASMVTEWILSLGREVASLGKPLQDTEVFPTTSGEVRYNVIALPLSDNQNDIDHVLYHLVPATGDQ